MSQERIKDITLVPPETWGISFAVSLVLTFVLHLLTRDKTQSVLSLSVVVYTILTGALSVFLRNHSIVKSIMTMAVGLSVARVVYPLSPLSLLILSLCPLLIRVASQEFHLRKK